MRRPGSGLPQLHRRWSEGLVVEGGVPRDMVLCGQSLLGIRHSARVQEGVDFGADGLGVADVLLLALARGRAFPLQCPRETDLLAVVLGDRGTVSLHHGIDGGVSTGLVALEEASIGIVVEGGDGSCN